MSIEVFNESGRGEVNEEELIDVARYALCTLGGWICPDLPM